MKKKANQKLFLSILSILLLSLIQSTPLSPVTADLSDMENYNFVAFVADGYDKTELNDVIRTLGFWGCDDPTIAGLEANVTSSYGDEETVDILISDVNVSEYDGVIIPGGGGPANLVESEEVLDKVREANSEGLVLAAICYGPLVLAEAGVVDGKNVTGNIDVSDELTAAGGNY